VSEREIRRTDQAREDLIEIYIYLHKRNPQAAERVLDASEATIHALLDVPVIGSRWETAVPQLQGMRVVPARKFRNYLIFFRSTPGGIELFRVVHGSRELERIVDDIQIRFEDQSGSE
jgi:toxin ParE1/3/4